MRSHGTESTPDEVFNGSPRGLELCLAVERMLAGPGGGHRSALSCSPRRPGPRRRSQGNQEPGRLPRRRRGFAYVWWPGRYVRTDVPAVLSIAVSSRIESPRFKSVVNPRPGLWMHHLELHSAEDLDAEVAGWLRQARDDAD